VPGSPVELLADLLVVSNAADTPFRDVRQALVEAARRLIADGLSIGTSGNLSVRLDDQVAITPSGMPYDEMCAEDIALVTLDGHPTEGSRTPSSELSMHLQIYRDTRARAIIHTHSPYATAVSCSCEELPAMHYMVAALGGPIRVAPYATFGSQELADVTLAALSQRRAALLQSHGAVTYGRSLHQAYERAELLEWLSQVYVSARVLGAPRILSPLELDDVAEQARRQSQRGTGDPGDR
jgi:L-fuculose-phosphate aldolase